MNYFFFFQVDPPALSKRLQRDNEAVILFVLSQCKMPVLIYCTTSSSCPEKRTFCVSLQLTALLTRLFKCLKNLKKIYKFEWVDVVLGGNGMSWKQLPTSTARKLKHRDITSLQSPLISKYLVQIRPRAWFFSVVLGHLQFSLASDGALTAHQFHKSGPCFKLNTWKMKHKQLAVTNGNRVKWLI